MANRSRHEPIFSGPVENDMYDDLMEDDRNANRFFPDTYLDSPVLITPRDHFMAEVLLDTRNQSVHGKLAKSFKKTFSDWPDFTLLEPQEYPLFYRYKWGNTLRDDLSQAIGVADVIWLQVGRALEKWCGKGLERINTMGNFSNAMEWLLNWSVFDSVILEIEKQSATTEKQIFAIKVEGIDLLCSRDIVIIKSARWKKILTYDQFLMFKDVFYSRANVIIALDVLYNADPELLSLVNDTMLWHEECLRVYGNTGFEILKQTEALSKTYLSHITDPVFGADGPYPRMLEKVREKEKKLERQSDFLCDRFDKVLSRTTNPQYITEVFGLLKISGHPLVNPEDGGSSAAKEAKIPDRTTLVSALRLNNEFKRCFCHSVIQQTGSWPDLIFPKASRHTKLYEYWKKQFRGIHRGSYPLSDWDHVRYAKFKDFDYSPNYMQLMDDKSIAFYRSNIAAAWCRDVDPTSERRLLLELVSREDFDIREIVERISRRDIPKDWLIVNLHPKEREFKIEARMFSMLVLEIRVYFALLEANIADYIFPYLPQQTMTKSSNQIQAQFLQMTSPLKDKDVLRMYFEIDLSRWNLRWRSLAIHMIGDTLNDMFGVSDLFTFVHWFFKESMIVVRVPGCEPEGIREEHPPESKLLWYNHLGGFEGICQKHWTIATYAMISLALNDLDLSYTLIGQGDNQVVTIRTTRRQGESAYTTLSNLRALLNTRIPAECIRVNQEVKPEECLESTSVVTYSKDVWINGVYHPTSLKFMSRLFPHSSQTFPSVRTNIGAIFSTAMAGAEKCDDPMKCYYLAILHSALYLYRLSSGRGIYGQQIRKIKRDYHEEKFADWVTFVLTLPSELGGYPILPFTGFVYKGGSDPLGKSVAAMSMLAFADGPNKARMFNRMLSQLYDSDIYQTDPQIATLLSDPFSIPIRKPVTAIDGVADMTIRELRDGNIIKLKDVRQLMSADMESYSKTIIDILSAVQPCNPILLRDVLDCSVLGTVSTVSKMFVATRTLQSVVRRVGIPVVDRVLRLECEGIIYLMRRFEMLPPDPAVKESIYSLTKRLRQMWYPDARSDVEGVTTYMPFDFEVDTTATGFRRQGINAVLVASSNPYGTRGPYHPYVGSKTREKRSEHGYKIIGTDSTSEAMRKLQLIVSQTGNDPAFVTIIDAIGYTRTNVKLSDYSSLLPGVSGGTLSHRYASRAGHLDAFNVGSPNFATHCVISTDNCYPLSGGMVDYPCMMQEYALAAQWVLMHKSSTNDMSGSVTLCADKIQFEPLPSVTVRGPTGIEIPIVQFPDNKLAFLPDLVLKRVSGLLHHKSVPLLSEFKPSREGRRQVLEALFRENLRSRGVGHLLADGSMTTHQFETMDILEAASNGLSIIAVAMANVCAESAIMHYLTTESRDKKRWRSETYLLSIVPGLTNVVAPLLGHPALRDDALVRWLRLYDSPIYVGGESRPTSRFAGYVVQLAKERVDGRSRDLVDRISAVFTTTIDNETSHVLFSRYTSLLHYWMQNNFVTPNLVRVFLGQTMLPWMRGQHEEKHKVAAMYLVMSQQAGTLLHHKQYTLSSELQDLADGKLVIGYKIAMKDMLRSTRDSVIWGSTKAKLKAPPRVKPRSISLEKAVTCSSKHPVLREGTRELQDQTTDYESRIRIWLYRSTGRIGVGSGSAIYCWSEFGKVLGQQSLIIIGVGMGAAARVALDNGCPSVFGLDLRASIPLKAHRFRFYRPPLVEDCERSTSYEQLSETFVTSGDWTDPEVVKSVLKYDPGDSTVLIDIEASDKRFGLELLVDVIQLKRSGIIILRLFTTGEEAGYLACDLTTSGFKFDLYHVDPTWISGSRVFVISRWKKRLLLASEPCYTTQHMAGIDDFDVVNDYDRSYWMEAVADATYNLVVPIGDSGILSCLHSLESMVLQVKGSYESRASYGQWTRLVSALLALKSVFVPQEHLVDWIRSIWIARCAHVRIYDTELEVGISWSTIAHICKYAARLREGDDRMLFVTS